MNLPHALQHEAVEITDTITKNYELMLQARGDTVDVLEKTFEQRMNQALEKYLDLAKCAGKITVSSAVEV